MVRLATGELLFERGDPDAPPDVSMEETPTVATVMGDGSAAEGVAAGAIEEEAAEAADRAEDNAAMRSMYDKMSPEEVMFCSPRKGMELQK